MDKNPLNSMKNWGRKSKNQFDEKSLNLIRDQE